MSVRFLVIYTPFTLYFDGPKDRNIWQFKEGAKFYLREFKEEHIYLVLESGLYYFRHLTPHRLANQLLNEVIDFLKKNDM